MASRNTLPDIRGGDHVLRDALGSSDRCERAESAQNEAKSVDCGRSLSKLENASLSLDSAPELRLKVKVPFNLPHDLAEEVRDTVFALSGPPHCLSLAGFAEQALRAELSRLQDLVNGGRRFRPRRGRLKPGRRVE